MALLLLCSALLQSVWQLEDGQADPAAGSQVTSDGNAQARAARPFHEIRSDMRTALKKEAGAAESLDWAATVVWLSDIYAEIQFHPRLDESSTLKGYRVKLRSRLAGIETRLKREMGRSSKGVAARPSVIDPAALRRLEERANQLSRSTGPSGDQGVVAPQGSPKVVGAGGGAARSDYGPLLVELIQRTIAPETWEAQGGTGTIAYYRPWYALVVRAKAQVHGQLGGAVDGLRK